MKIDLDTVLAKTNRYYAAIKGRDTEDCLPVPSEQIRALAKALVEEANSELAYIEVRLTDIKKYADQISNFLLAATR